jgi:hypothetical protein
VAVLLEHRREVFDAQIFATEMDESDFHRING